MYGASFASAALLGLASSLAAQEPMRAGSPLIPHVSASAAFDLRNGQSASPAMYLGMASLEWSTRVPGLGIRLDAIYANRKYDIRVQPQECGPLCSPSSAYGAMSVYSSKVSAQAAFVEATYEIVRRGAFRPYLVGGAGAVQTHEKSITGVSLVCSAQVCATANWTNSLSFRDERPITGAATAGVGAAYSWRWISVVAETRYYAVAHGVARGLGGAFPLSLGVRF